MWPYKTGLKYYWITQNIPDFVPEYPLVEEDFWQVVKYSPVKEAIYQRVLKTVQNCQALSFSQSLYLSLSLRDRDRADTIITFHHHHHHRKLFKHLEVTYSQVWYIIGIVSSSPTYFHSEKIGLIRVTYDPLSVLGLINF